MDETGFWSLIDECREQAGGTGEPMAQLLRERLVLLDVPSLRGFTEHWDDAHERAFTWPVWDAACLLLGWVGDDSFHDVRAWLILT